MNDLFAKYEITAEGKALQHTGDRTTELPLITDKNGYLRIKGHNPFKPLPAQLHRLVAAFHLPTKPNVENRRVMLRHLNGDKHDNRAANLAWGTAADNYADDIQHGVRGTPTFSEKLARAISAARAARFLASRTARTAKPSPAATRAKRESGYGTTAKDASNHRQNSGDNNNNR